MPAKNRVPATVWLKPGEKREIVSLARQTRLTTSELIRRLVLGRKLPDARRFEAVRSLAKVNGDLARLGNLLRMALADEDFRPPGNMDMASMFESIRNTQLALKAKIKAL